MSKRTQISCIRKRNRQNPHERIQAFGGPNPPGSEKDRWRMDEEHAIAAATTRSCTFFVNINGHEIDVVVAEHLGRKYLKTKADSYAPNHLLSLPECP